jgi:hypothetical protein
MEDKTPKTINRGVEDYKVDLEEYVSLRGWNRLWPNPCMQNKRKKIVVYRAATIR